MYNENDPLSVEKYSSAVTLSDMEVFIFPELMMSLVIANMMSPKLWQWKSDPWFSKTGKASPLKRVQRLKQYIMDHFTFNLDLDTWGLTTKEKELARFSAYIDESILAKSNALLDMKETSTTSILTSESTSAWINILLMLYLTGKLKLWKLWRLSGLRKAIPLVQANAFHSQHSMRPALQW